MNIYFDYLNVYKLSFIFRFKKKEEGLAYRGVIILHIFRGFTKMRRTETRGRKGSKIPGFRVVYFMDGPL